MAAKNYGRDMIRTSYLLLAKHDLCLIEELYPYNNTMEMENTIKWKYSTKIGDRPTLPLGLYCIGEARKNKFRSNYFQD